MGFHTASLKQSWIPLVTAAVLAITILTQRDLCADELYPIEGPVVTSGTVSQAPYAPEAIKQYNRGVELQSSGFFSQALDAYRAATVSDSRMAEAWTNSGAAYAALRDYDKALEAYRHALLLKPYDPVASEGLKRILCLVGKTGEFGFPFRPVETSLNGTNTLFGDKDSGGGLPLRTYVCRELEPAALEVETELYQSALYSIDKVKPSSPPAAAESHYLKALCLQSLGRFEESAKEYKWVEGYTYDPSLKGRCAIGLKAVDLRNRTLSNEQIHIPGSYRAPDQF